MTEFHQPPKELGPCKACGAKIVYHDGIKECYMCRDKACTSEYLTNLKKDFDTATMKIDLLLAKNDVLESKLKITLLKLKNVKLHAEADAIHESNVLISRGSHCPFCRDAGD